MDCYISNKRWKLEGSLSAYIVPLLLFHRQSPNLKFIKFAKNCENVIHSVFCTVCKVSRELTKL